MVPSSYNVLLIEDVQLLAKVTEQMLKKSPVNKYSLAHRMTLASALEKLKGEDFDMVLLDLNLPDSEELNTLQAVLEAAPDVPVIVLTATQSYDIGFKSIKLGAQDFLVKGDFNFLTLDRAIVYGIERHRLRKTIQQLAVIDELTGLYNRRGYNTLYPDIIQRSKQSDARGYLCYFDLDRFKQINDELGHQKGDEALVEFATNLRSIFPKDALLVRLGGDEFVGMGIERAPGQAVESVNALGIVLDVRNHMGHPPFHLEASAGLALFDKNGPHAIEELKAAADAALYRDKEARRHERIKAGLQTQDERR